MASPLLIVRGAKSEDANSIIDIDIKCFEGAWSPEDWSRIGHSPGYAISVATDRGTPVGFGVFRHDHDTKSVEIVKLAVKGLHRRKGISRQLLSAGMDFAIARNSDYLYIVIAETTVYPGPRNISKWLKAVGFEAKEFIRNFFTLFGEPEDGVKFITPINRRLQ